MEAYQIRMKVEYSQLEFRIERLDSFVHQQESNRTVDDTEYNLLLRQLQHMKEYRDVLLKRCKIHNII